MGEGNETGKKYGEPKPIEVLFLLFSTGERVVEEHQGL